MKLWILILLFIGLCCFSVYTYKVRNEFNVDKQEAQLEECQYKVDALKYALSLVPESIRNEVFFNAIVLKYPEIKEDKGIMDLKFPKPKEVEEEKEEEKEESVTVMSALDAML